MSESTIPQHDPAELARLEAEFEANGGRGVALADDIDRLRQERDFVTLTIVVPRNAAETFEQTGVPHFDTSEVMFWYGEAGVTEAAIDAGADPAMWA